MSITLYTPRCDLPLRILYRVFLEAWDSLSVSLVCPGCFGRAMPRFRFGAVPAAWLLVVLSVVRFALSGGGGSAAWLRGVQEAGPAWTSARRGGSDYAYMIFCVSYDN